MATALNESLNHVLDIVGVRTMELIDFGSGTVVASADGDGTSFPTDLSAAAASMADAYLAQTNMALAAWRIGRLAHGPLAE